MAVIKLYYFDLAGRAELIRLCFAYGNVEFEDYRFKEGEFASMKDQFPFGQVPALEIDGQIYAQSMALARYAAKLSGLYPADPVHACLVDMFVDSLQELFQVGGDYLHCKEEGLKAEKKLKLETEIVRVLGKLNALASGPYLTGEKPTLPDVQLFFMVKYLLGKKMKEVQFEGNQFAKIADIADKVESLPTIAAYLAKSA